MKLLTVTSYKGGCAKSTTSIHLAAYFSDRHKVLLIDGDPNKTSLEWAGRGHLPFTVADERKAIRLIPEHEIIVFDTQARPGSEDLKELLGDCDMMVLPTFPDILSLGPMLATARDLVTLDQSAKDKYRALICNVPPAPSTDGQVMREDLQQAGIPVFQTLIRRTIGFPKAALEGVTIRDLKDTRNRLGWRDYEALGKEIDQIWANSKTR